MVNREFARVCAADLARATEAAESKSALAAKTPRMPSKEAHIPDSSIAASCAAEFNAV
jgi:hypothetical protein